MLDITDAENNFSMENAMTKNVPRSLPSTNPLYSFNPIIYKAPPSEDDLEALKKPLTPITPEKINKEESEMVQRKEKFRKNIISKSNALNL